MQLHPSEAIKKMITSEPITLILKAELPNDNNPLPVPSDPRDQGTKGPAQTSPTVAQNYTKLEQLIKGEIVIKTAL